MDQKYPGIGPKLFSLGNLMAGQTQVSLLEKIFPLFFLEKITFPL